MTERKTIAIDYRSAVEMLNMADAGVFLCENILKRKANAKYITEHEFATCFAYMQRVLGPAVYGKHWRGPT